MMINDVKWKLQTPHQALGNTKPLGDAFDPRLMGILLQTSNILHQWPVREPKIGGTYHI